MRRKIVQLRSHRVEETQFFRLVLDLNLFKEQQRINQIIFKESLWFPTASNYISWIRAASRIGAN